MELEDIARHGGQLEKLETVVTSIRQKKVCKIEMWQEDVAWP